MNKFSLPITIIIASVLLGGFFYATQVKKQESIERQHQQDLLLQEKIAKINAQQQPDKTSINSNIPDKISNPTIDQSNLFEKKISCQKYTTEIEKRFYNQTSVSVFYSTLVNSCVYESIAIKNGEITSQIVADVLNDKTYVFKQDTQYYYDTDLFGPNKTYSDVLTVLKGS